MTRAATKTAPIRPATLSVEIRHTDGRCERIEKAPAAAATFAAQFNRSAAARGLSSRASVALR